MTDTNTLGFEFIQELSTELSAGQVKLPAFPDVALRIKKALEDPDMSVGQIGKLVGADPVFSARLLKVANSAALNASGKQVKDIPAAVTRVGFKMAHNIAVSVAMEQVMEAPDDPALATSFSELWQHSMEVAAYSYVVAKKQMRHSSLRRAKINPDEAMLAGLMHDIGKTYILTRATKHPELIQDQNAMMAVMADWHTGIGSAIVENWGFDEELMTVADEHELLDREPSDPGLPTDLCDVVLVANLLAQARECDDSGVDSLLKEWLQIPAFARLGLDSEMVTEIRESSSEEIQSIVSALGG